MKRFIVGSILLWSWMMCMAQSPIAYSLSDNSVYHGKTTRINQKGLTVPADGAKLIVYPAKQSNGKAIICCPGGGYMHLAINHEGYDFAPWLNSLGFTYAVLVYNMPEGNSQIPIGDVHKAFALMKQHKKEWQIDQIGVMGFSAGGHLASTAATHYTAENRPDFQILFYPVITMDEHFTHMGSRRRLLGDTPEVKQVDQFSNEKQVTAHTPKAFIMHCTDDKVVPVKNSIDYYMALKDHGISATLHIYPIGGHGWGYRDKFGYKEQWKAELEKWLKEL